MIPVPSGVRVWLAVGHTDMRRGMNGLALQVQQALGRDPQAACRARIGGAVEHGAGDGGHSRAAAGRSARHGSIAATGGPRCADAARRGPARRVECADG